MMNKKLLVSLTSVVLAISLAACGTSNQESKQGENPSDSSSSENLQSVIYTADEGGSMTKIDASTNQVLNTIEIEGAVHNAQISPDGKIVGATVVPAMSEMDGMSNMEGMEEEEHVEESGHEMNGYVYFYDTITDELIKKVEVGAHPAHIVFTSNGKYVLVSNNEGNNVTILDAKTYETVSVIPTGKGPHGFRVSTDSNYAYIANMNEDTVSVINLRTLEEEKKIQVGSTPVTTGVTSDGKTLVVPINAENAAAIIDLSTENIVKVPVGEGPAQVYIQSDNKYALVANQGTEQNPSNSVSKIDLSSQKVVATVETGDGAHGVVISKDNKIIYVTNMFGNTVSVIDNDKNEVIGTIKVGNTPNGITITQ